MLRATHRLAALAAIIATALPPAVLPSWASAAQAATIDHAVLASLPVWHGHKADIVDHFDLARPFATRTPWTLVVAKFTGSPPAELSQTEAAGPLAICFVKELTPHCAYTLGLNDSSVSWFDMPYELLSSRVVFAGAGRTDPLLLLVTGGPHGGDGSHLIQTQLFAYDRQSDRFQTVFSHGTGSNNNQETRFVEQGPLRGDVIVAVPTGTPPFGYWISVYTRARDGQYSHLALRYRSRTRYGDGNPLAVIDSEMPNILHRFGKWKPGAPLPVPPQMPSYCRHNLAVVAGEEWCRRE